MASNIVNYNENILRHIMAIHFDSSSKVVKPSAFDINTLKKGLSVSIKSNMDHVTKKYIISQLQINGGTYECDFEANCGDITSILYVSNNVFCVFETPKPNNKSHADIEFCSNVKNENPSQLRKLRKELMDKFIVVP